jgi:hypothetical protein
MGVDLIANAIRTFVMLRVQAALIGFVGRLFPKRFFLQLFQNRPQITVVQIEGPPVDPGNMVLGSCFCALASPRRLFAFIIHCVEKMAMKTRMLPHKGLHPCFLFYRLLS